MSCIHCGGLTRRSTYKYCSNQCQQDYQWAELRAEMEARGEILAGGKNGDGGSNAIRYVRETQGCHCAVCKRKTWNGEPIPLVLDHIDGNSWN
jgi:16S rRNA G1207 methylase RsmC